MSTLSFKTPGIAAVWLCEIRGQFSDGYYENNDAWEDEECSELLQNFLSATVEVKGDEWKAGLDTGSRYRKCCPLSGSDALWSLISYLRNGEKWAWRVPVYYALGEKYDLDKLCELSDSYLDSYLVSEILERAWEIEKHYASDSYRKKKLEQINKIIDVEEAVAYFKTINKDEVLRKLTENVEELDAVLNFK